MNILKKELYYNRYSLLTWTAILVALSVYTMALFPSLQSQMANVEELMKSMPESLLKAFNMDALSMSDALEYYASKGLFMVLIFGGIYSGLMAATAISKEEENRTIEFLLSRPVSRSEIITSKILYHFIYIAAFSIVVTAATALVTKAVVDTPFNMAAYTKLMWTMFLVHMAIGGISFLIGVLKTNSRNLVIGFVLIEYFLSTMSSLSENTEFLGYFSVFKYMDLIELVKHNTFNLYNALVLIGIYVVSLALTYYIYQKKDITT